VKQYDRLKMSWLTILHFILLRGVARLQGILCSGVNRYYLLLLMFPSSIGFTKCISETHIVSGLITKNTLPLSNIGISVSFADGLKKRIEKTALTDNNGGYQIEIRYSTYSGSYIFGPERCEFILDKLHLKIELGGQEETLQEIIFVSGNETIYNKALNAMNPAT